MKIFAGTSGYGYEEWRGKFYPEKLLPRRMLAYYAGRLEAVEVNTTFYRMPETGVLRSWAEQVPPGFVFAVKAPRVITHLKRLRNAEKETGFFLESLAVLGKKLGPVLFQFPPGFREDRGLLEKFLRLVPDRFRCAFEFRNPSWIDPWVADMLWKKDCAFCLADIHAWPAEEYSGNQPGWGYLRLRRGDYTDDELSRVVGWIIGRKWTRTYVFFSHEGGMGPELARRLRGLARENQSGAHNDAVPSAVPAAGGYPEWEGWS